jgi:hypothetical protein
MEDHHKNEDHTVPSPYLKKPGSKVSLSLAPSRKAELLEITRLSLLVRACEQCVGHARVRSFMKSNLSVPMLFHEYARQEDILPCVYFLTSPDIIRDAHA